MSLYRAANIVAYQNIIWPVKIHIFQAKFVIPLTRTRNPYYFPQTFGHKISTKSCLDKEISVPKGLQASHRFSALMLFKADWLTLLVHLCKSAAVQPITVQLLMQKYQEDG